MCFKETNNTIKGYSKNILLNARNLKNAILFFLKY